MAQYRVTFDRFLTETIGINGGRYDFIVPIESKGATLFDTLYQSDQRTLFNAQVYYPRAFDFLPLADVTGRRAAAIDDTLFSGRTLRTVKRDLEARGVSVDTFAFAMDCTTAKPGDRDDEVRAATRSAIKLLDRRAYKRYLMELRDWATHARIPAAYDHLVFTLPVSRERLEEVLACLHRHASVLAYGRRGKHDTWSVVLPADDFWLGVYHTLRVAVPPKIRLWYDSTVLSIVPMWGLDTPVPLTTPLDDIIKARVKDELTHRRDRLDALSLTGRAHMLAALAVFLPEVKDARLERRHLDRTFTRPISERLEATIAQLVREQSSLIASPIASPMLDDESEIIPYWALASEILDDVRSQYEGQALPRWQRESRGYTISEITDKYAQPLAVHAAVDYLIDHGYLASYHGPTARNPLTRGVRSTETYDAFVIEKLIATYARLANDHRVTATEAHKLFSIFHNCFGMQLDGIALKVGLGGETAQRLLGVEDREDVTAVLNRSTLLTRNGKSNTGYYSYDASRDEDELTGDPVVERDYGRLRAVVEIVHNATASLTPPQRATLLSTIAHDRHGLALIAHDAGAIATGYGAALNKVRPHTLFAPPKVNKERDQMGRAYNEGTNKLRLLANADEFRRSLPETNDPYEHKLLTMLQAPQRWNYLLQFWQWYFDAFYATTRLVLDAGNDTERQTAADQIIEATWTVGPELAHPYADSMREHGQAWRNALSGHGITQDPGTLPTTIGAGTHWYAHYDLAASSKQIEDRDAWFAGSATIIHDWARLFSCQRSSSRETQAESGFLWSSNYPATLHASAWAAYMLWVLSELEHPQAEWIPIFCLCQETAPANAVGQRMAGSAKVTKGVSRAHADTIAQAVRDYERNSLNDRLFIVGKAAIEAAEQYAPGLAKDRSAYAQRLNIEVPLAMIPLDEYFQQFLSKLPKPPTVP